MRKGPEGEVGEGEEAELHQGSFHGVQNSSGKEMHSCEETKMP